jgi:hypothetical protein
MLTLYQRAAGISCSCLQYLLRPVRSAAAASSHQLSAAPTVDTAISVRLRGVKARVLLLPPPLPPLRRWSFLGRPLRACCCCCWPILRGVWHLSPGRRRLQLHT